MSFFLETLVGGLLAGTMYALVAIGFVLIYKASGVFNFAQGAMVLFAALTFVTLTEKGVPLAIAVVLTVLVMIALATLIERFVLRSLVNRSPMTLFMATLGLSYMIEGTAQLLMGASVHQLDLGIPDVPLQLGTIQVSSFDLVAAATAVSLAAILSLSFSFTRLGLSLRAVADDVDAALSLGLKLPPLWTAVWAVAGVVAFVAGLLWGRDRGCNSSLTFVVLKALPVLIIGGFTSLPGAIVGGLIVGASDALAEVYLGPLLGGSVSTWFAYCLAVGFLLIRPAGLFGDRVIERI